MHKSICVKSHLKMHKSMHSLKQNISLRFTDGSSENLMNAPAYRQTHSRLTCNNWRSASPTQSKIDREEVKSVITRCEHLTSIDAALKSEATQDVKQLTTYFKRFSNHLGVVMCDPESTIDLPFQHDIEYRTNETSKKKSA